MSANEYISLARNYSFVLLLVTYLALDGTASFLRRIHLLDGARRAFAEVMVFRANGVFEARQTPPPPDPGEAPLPPETVVLVFKEPGIGRVEVRERRQRAGAGDAEARRMRLQQQLIGPPAPAAETLSFTLTVTREDGRQWEVPVANASAENQPKALREAREQLVGTFYSIWRKAPADLEKPHEVLAAIEYELVDQTVPVPGLDVKFSSRNVPWIFLLLVLGLLIQIRNQVRRGLLDPGFAIEEPWLVLDGQRGLERLLAGLWTALIAGAPWLVGGCLLAVLTCNLDPRRTLTSSPLVVVEVGGALVLFALGGWISLTVSAEILRLRRLRLGKLAELKETIAATTLAEPP